MEGERERESKKKKGRESKKKKGRESKKKKGRETWDESSLRSISSTVTCSSRNSASLLWLVASLLSNSLTLLV